MDNINVEVGNQLNNQQLPEKSKKIFSGPKIIFLILGLIILGELIYAIKVLSSPTPASLPPVQKTAAEPTEGKISLTVPKTSFSVKEVVSISVKIDTGGHVVSGVDLIIRFDPKVFEATRAGLVKGKILDEYPVMSVDASKGLISISGISNFKNGFSGKGEFALINLKSKTAGATSLTIEFTKGSTVDSNLVEADKSKDILEAVDNLDLTIQ